MMSMIQAYPIYRTALVSQPELANLTVHLAHEGRAHDIVS